MFRIICISIAAVLLSCQASTQQPSNDNVIFEKALLVKDVPLPPGYNRITYPQSTQAAFLRSLSLKADKKVYLYNGEEKTNQSAQYAVLDIDVGKKDLQQCADAAMRLRAEYLWKQKDYHAISFRFTNGFNCDYTHYANGHRIKISGNKCSWQKQARESNSYGTFREYLDLVFSYAGTRSLHAQLKSIDVKEIQPGAIFIQTGNPYGHAVTVMDMAYNPATKDTIFLLSQSYMPAQDIHILNNPFNKNLSPWYSTDFEYELVTPEWTFNKNDLKRF